MIIKPEETDDFIRIPVAERKPNDTIRTITIDSKKGITALVATDRKKILTYIFNKKKYPWTMELAQQWIQDHKEAKNMDVNDEILLITQRLKLKDVSPGIAEQIAKEHNLKSEDVCLIRKGLTPVDTEFIEGEKSVVTYITTNSVDRDNEIVIPQGAILTDYLKNPVVLFGHDYHSLPIGKNEWIRIDEKGLIAKTTYANTPEAEKIYQYRKDGFPLGESIGFVPLEFEDLDEEKSKEMGGARRIYTKWVLLEYSDVPIPSNPDAIQLAISKGLLKINTEKIKIKEEKELIEDPERELEIKQIKEQAVEEYIKAGRVLSNKNRKLIKECSDMLIKLYELSMPKEDNDGKNIEVALQKLETLSKAIRDITINL